MELTPTFQFDSAKLDSLEMQIPPSLQILRLRLRFGLPPTLRVGQSFRIALDLVDEMGQPAQLCPEMVKELFQITITHEVVPNGGDCSSRGSEAFDLQVREIGVSAETKKSCLKWHFDVQFRKLQQTAASNQMHDDRLHGEDKEAVATNNLAVCLRIRLTKASSDLDARRTAFQTSFQQFCLHSEWINDDTLILPIQSDSIQLLPAAASEEPQKAKSNCSSICQRIFSVPTTTPHSSGKMVTIQENYGDTMGSHIWDASILLSFTLVYATRQSPISSSSRVCLPRHVMLELGAGCGLFAAVYSIRFCSDGASGNKDLEAPPLSATGNTMLLTERAESLALLTSNLRRNCGHSLHLQRVLPLVWGREDAIPHEFPRVHTIFASDVLYNWAVHEALLTTIEQIRQRSRNTTDAAACEWGEEEGLSSVIIAHKHRGKATSAALENVLQGECRDCGCTESAAKRDVTAGDGGGSSCQWENWSVTRVARLGKIDVLRLTHR